MCGEVVFYYPGYKDNIPGATKNLCKNSEIEDLSIPGIKYVLIIRVRAFHAPCHTKGHILYYMEAENPVNQEILFSEDNPETCIVNRALFTGDTIFIGGVGKFFEGSASEMARNIEWVKSLPHNTHIFCGHDYLEGNIKYAKTIEPENEAYDLQLQRLQANVIAGTHQLPSTIGQECKSNIFFRHDLLLQKLGAQDKIEALAKLREFKDNGQKL